MSDVATSVRINGSARDILASLSAKLNQPKAQIIEIALRRLEEQTFWADVQKSFDQVASNPADNKAQLLEFALWENASERDFVDEKW